MVMFEKHDKDQQCGSNSKHKVRKHRDTNTYSFIFSWRITVSSASIIKELRRIAPVATEKVVTIKLISIHLFRSVSQAESILGIGSIGKHAGKVVTEFTFWGIQIAIVARFGEVLEGVIDIKGTV